MNKKCPICGKILGDKRSSYCLSCAKKGNRNPMYGLYGEQNPLWKGGRKVSKNGYMQIRIRRKAYYEHRLIMEKHLGRKLRKNETVHHINGNKLDNRIENLKLVSNQAEHMRNHIGIPYKKVNNDKQRQCYQCKKILPLNETNFYYPQPKRMYEYSYICRECNKKNNRNKYRRSKSK